jgi:uncharacterized protein YyaL (SSP411 family)
MIPNRPICAGGFATYSMSPVDSSFACRGGLRVSYLARGLASALGALLIAANAAAWEHGGSKVEFTEYREGLIQELRSRNRPYFLLFSAEWCYWCHQFGEFTLKDDKVADYLNENYSNVFIDADIHSAAYLKYRATGLPFTVFLNPDTSPQFRYAGTLYPEDFLTVIKRIKTNVTQGLSVEGSELKEYAYEPPDKLALAVLKETVGGFHTGLLENFDPEEHGLGKGEKAIYPGTFLYLLSGSKGQTRQAAVQAVHNTLDRAIERIYDPVEGGFFRYAETREWKVPHYEKMSDINAGTVLLIFRLDSLSPSPALVKAADKTLGYLRTQLYDQELGVFLSFQQADEHYYTIKTPADRQKADKPPVIEKVYIDRLARAVSYLIDVLDYRDDGAFKKQILSSLDFVEAKLAEDGTLNRYYTVRTRDWSGKGTLQDYALVANMFLNASSRFQSARYRDLARQTADKAIELFFDESIGVLTDPSLGDTNDAEFLMEVNGLMAQALIGLKDGGSYADLSNAIITYFSAMGDILEERLWDAKDWEFTERYVPYLRATESYLNGPELAAH